MRPNVIIVVLNWNGLTDTLECLASLARLDCPANEVVVVDNGSTDGSVAAIQTHFPQVTLMENGKNLGFVGGNNVGLRHAMNQGADYVFLLNNDTVVDPLLLRQLVEAAESDPAIGVVGPTIYYYDAPETIWSAGGAIDWRKGNAQMVGLGERDAGRFGSEPREVDFVTGCAMLIRHAVLKQAGLLDDRFFSYYEEAEWCVRARRAGFNIVHLPLAKVWHKISPERRADSPLVHYYMTRNRLLFLKAVGADWRAWLHTLFAEYLRTLVSWSLWPRWRNKRSQRDAMVQAIVDAWRGRWGQKVVV